MNSNPGRANFQLLSDYGIVGDMDEVCDAMIAGRSRS